MTVWCAGSITTHARLSNLLMASLGAQNAILGGGRYDGCRKLSVGLLLRGLVLPLAKTGW